MRNRGRISRIGRLGLLGIALVLGLSACDETGGPDGGSTGFPPIVLTAEEQAGYDALILDLLGADGLSGRLASYWPEAYAAMVIGDLYRAPVDVTAYEGAPQESACGPLSTDNAWYCETDEEVYYDDNFLRTLYRAYGIAAPTILLAHEWGHHIQTVMGAPSTSIASELQADCFAGMFFGTEFIPPAGEPDLRSAGATLFLLGDDNYSASTWFAPNVHGPPSWRTKAFLDGMLGEGAYCVDYRDWTERGVMTLGSYQWLPAPNIEVTNGQNGALVATLRGRTAILSDYGSPGATTTALTYMPTVFQEWFGGGGTPVGPALDIETGDGVGGILGGTGAVQGYQYTDQAGIQQHGVLFLHVGTNGDAALVSVFEPGPPPAADLTDPAWNPLLNYMFVVGFSLCPADGAGALCIALGGE